MPSGALSRACPPLSLDADGARPGRSFFFASLSSRPPCGLLGFPCSVRDPTSSLIFCFPLSYSGLCPTMAGFLTSSLSPVRGRGGLRGGPYPPPLCRIPGLGRGFFVCCWGFVSLRVCVCVSARVWGPLCTPCVLAQDSASGHPDYLYCLLFIMVQGRGGCW